LNTYDWIKALHIVAVMTWMAGMLPLPWLFVLHGDAAFGSCTSEFLKMIERRLLRVVVNPAMIVAWIAGPYLAWSAHWWTTGWFQAKFALVLALSGVHGSGPAGRSGRQRARGVHLSDRGVRCRGCRSWGRRAGRAR